MTYQLKNLNVASLDFDNIKQSLSTFFKQQNELKDLDFDNEASSVNLLLNMLATVTAYNGVYAQYGYVNSFATTANILESVLGIASNNSVLIVPTQSASVQRTVTAVGATLAPYSAFTAQATNGANIFFFNLEQVPINTAKSINLYSGSAVLTYTNYDYTTQSCELPYTVNPNSISMLVTDTSTNITKEWTKVDKSATTVSGNNTHFTVINGPKGYIVTNNFSSSQTISTAYKVSVKAIIGNGGLGNNASITSRADTQFNTSAFPAGGYDLISVNQAKYSLLFKATGQERCVTMRDYKNAIMSSKLPYTDDESNITVSNGSYPAQVKVYVKNLSTDDQATLMSYLQEKALAGISIVYSL